MADDAYQWREIQNLLPEHRNVLEWLEAEMLKKHVPPDEVRVALLERADDFRDRTLGDAVLAGVPTPTGAGYWSGWQFADGLYTRDFEGRNNNVHGIEIQIVGTQSKDAWRECEPVSTERKVRISGQADLTSDQAEEVALWITGQVKEAQNLDRSDNEG